jgi:hypothetical protein
LPEPVSKRLRDMAFKTRRSKQEICLEFIRRRLDEYWRSQGGRGGSLIRIEVHG